LHGLDVGNGREIEVLAPDEGGELLQELPSRAGVARAGAGLDPGGALPVLPPAFVIGERGVDGDGDGSGARIGPEANVGAEDVTIAGAVLHDRDEMADHADVEFVVV